MSQTVETREERLATENMRLRNALMTIMGGCSTAERLFRAEMGDRKSPTWRAVNQLQDSLAAIEGTAAIAMLEPPR